MQILCREWPVFGITALALVLRCYQLLDQVPIDDEWHALNQAMTRGIGDVLTQFGTSDVAIPIAAYYKLLISTVGLSEWGLRVPFLVLGIATVVGFPLMVRPFVGRSAANVFGAMLCVSPILIFFSRFARPYAIALFCAFSAAMAFYAWWVSGRWRWAAAYVTLAATACWFVIIVAPFAMGPFVLFGVAAVFGRAGRRTAALKRLGRLGLTTAGTLAVLMGPGLYFDSESLLSHAGGETMRPVDVYNGAVQAIGNGTPLLALGIGGLATFGVTVVSRRQPGFVIYLLGLAALQVAGFVLMMPVVGRVPTVGARYMLTVLPVILLFAAAGIEAIGERFGGRARGQVGTAIGAVVCGAMLLCSPVVLIVQRPNNWASQYLGANLDFYRHFYVRNVRGVPEFYATLAARPPGSLRIVEASHSAFVFYNPLAFYQRIHRQPTLIGMHNGLCGPPVWGEVPYTLRNVSLRTHVFLADVDGMRRRGVSYVIFHRDLYRETRQPPGWVRGFVNMPACIDRFRRRVGAPVFEDANIAVFELRQDR